MEISSRRRIGICCSLSALVGLLAFTTACGGNSDEPENVSAADVKKEAREGIEAAADYATAQRKKLTQRAMQSVNDAERELSEARGELAELPNEARDRLEAAIERAQRARNALRAEIEQLKQVGEDRWAIVEKRLSDSLAEMAEARGEIAAALSGEEKEPEKS